MVMEKYNQKKKKVKWLNANQCDFSNSYMGESNLIPNTFLCVSDYLMIKTSKHDRKYGEKSDCKDSWVEILIETKNRGLDLRVNIDCHFTVNYLQPTGGP